MSEDAPTAPAPTVVWISSKGRWRRSSSLRTAGSRAPEHRPVEMIGEVMRRHGLTPAPPA